MRARRARGGSADGAGAGDWGRGGGGSRAGVWVTPLLGRFTDTPVPGGAGSRGQGVHQPRTRAPELAVGALLVERAAGTEGPGFRTEEAKLGGRTASPKVFGREDRGLGSGRECAEKSPGLLRC